MRAKIFFAFILVIGGAVGLVHASVAYAFQMEMIDVVPVVTATAALLGGVALMLSDSNPQPISSSR